MTDKINVKEYFLKLEDAVPAINAAREELERHTAHNFRGISEYIAPNENMISKIWADLLNPQGIHGQGILFLKKFIHTFVSHPQKYKNLKNTVVRLEAPVKTDDGVRRIDILIENDDWVIGIENKPWALEQHEQLEDYYDFLDKKKKADWHLLYIAGRNLNYTSIESETVDKNTFAAVPFVGKDKNKPDVLKWLESCQAESRADRVKWFLQDLIEYSQDTFPALAKGDSVDNASKVVKHRVGNISFYAEFALKENHWCITENLIKDSTVKSLRAILYSHFFYAFHQLLIDIAQDLNEKDNAERREKFGEWCVTTSLPDKKDDNLLSNPDKSDRPIILRRKKWPYQTGVGLNRYISSGGVHDNIEIGIRSPRETTFGKSAQKIKNYGLIEDDISDKLQEIFSPTEQANALHHALSYGKHEWWWSAVLNGPEFFEQLCATEVAKCKAKNKNHWFDLFLYENFYVDAPSVTRLMAHELQKLAQDIDVIFANMSPSELGLNRHEFIPETNEDSRKSPTDDLEIIVFSKSQNLDIALSIIEEKDVIESLRKNQEA